MSMLTDQEINDRVVYHPPTDAAKKLHEMVRAYVETGMKIVNYHLPQGREASVAITKLEEFMFWSNASIARNHDMLREAE